MFKIKVRNLTLAFAVIASFGLPIVKAPEASAETCMISNALSASWGCGATYITRVAGTTSQLRAVAVIKDLAEDGYCVEAVATFSNGTRRSIATSCGPQVVNYIDYSTNIPITNIRLWRNSNYLTLYTRPPV